MHTINILLYYYSLLTLPTPNIKLNINRGKSENENRKGADLFLLNASENNIVEVQNQNQANIIKYLNVELATKVD